ncbi:Glycerate kinase [Frankliniella fusca]|uniref:Glycerate kinase n=1 Tax=Frankliniella fusca TaxID=407009 RepID=A0AAE1HIT6_9NEOP|nr:Glycerate kinase [Frankliniella fusca]
MDNLTYQETLEHTKAAFLAAVSAVKPAHLIENAVQINGRIMTVKGTDFQLKQPCYVIGFGKAVLEMALTMEKKLGNLMKKCIISVPVGIQEIQPIPSDTKVEILQGAANNLPDKLAEDNARRILKVVKDLQKDDTLIVLISGGGSALLPLPLEPLTLEEKLQVIKKLANAGADILQLNCVRKCLSAVKGGGLAAAAQPATVISLILSDVIGDPVDFIASGPTASNKDSPTAAWDIICKFQLQNSIPKSVESCLLSSYSKPRNLEGKGVYNILIGNNSVAITAAKNSLVGLNYSVCILSSSIQGNVSRVALLYSQLACRICKVLLKKECNLFEGLEEEFLLSSEAEDDLKKAIYNSSSTRGLCLIAGGETTVKVTGTGKGGRNQELALRFAEELKKVSTGDEYANRFSISLLSAGTDGIDGPTNAAGAFGYAGQLDGNEDYRKYLEDNDTHTFYSNIDDGKNLILTGHTGTNVMDIHILTISNK